MSSPQYRRRRGTPTVAMHLFVAPDVKELIEEYVSITGAPQWAVVEAAIRAGKPGRSGVPAGWDLPAPESLPIEDGLPLTG